MATVKERPILFSGPMVRAAIRKESPKTQMRRVVKSPAKNMQNLGIKCIQHREPGDPWYRDHVWSMRNRNGAWADYTHDKFMEKCPYGVPCDRLWVREAWQDTTENCHCDGPCYCDHSKDIIYRADAKDPEKYDWRPSIHMPRKACRLILEITGIRVERVQDISQEDAIAEGATCQTLDGPHPVIRWMMDWPKEKEWWAGLSLPTAQMAFANYLCRLHDGKKFLSKPDNIWTRNPWVWVIEFRRLDNERDG